jgi:hypothetical protein
MMGQPEYIYVEKCLLINNMSPNDAMLYLDHLPIMQSHDTTSNGEKSTNKVVL